MILGRVVAHDVCAAHDEDLVLLTFLQLDERVDEEEAQIVSHPDFLVPIELIFQ